MDAFSVINCRCTTIQIHIQGHIATTAAECQNLRHFVAFDRLITRIKSVYVTRMRSELHHLSHLHSIVEVTVPWPISRQLQLFIKCFPPLLHVKTQQHQQVLKEQHHPPSYYVIDVRGSGINDGWKQLSISFFYHHHHTNKERQTDTENQEIGLVVCCHAY